MNGTTIAGGAGDGLNVNISAALAGSQGFTYTSEPGSTAGALTLSGDNSGLTGTITVSTGELELANANAALNNTLALASGTSLLFTNSVTAFTVGGLSGAAGFNLVDGSSAVTLSIGNDNTNESFSGAWPALARS